MSGRSTLQRAFSYATCSHFPNEAPCPNLHLTGFSLQRWQAGPKVSPLPGSDSLSCVPGLDPDLSGPPLFPSESEANNHVYTTRRSNLCTRHGCYGLITLISLPPFPFSSTPTRLEKALLRRLSPMSLSPYRGSWSLEG